MPKPTSVPEWASSGSTSEPVPGKKAVGWVPGERPGPKALNWWQKLVYQWLDFLNPLFTTDGGFTAANNQHVTVQGTGRFKHGDQIRHVSPAGGSGTGWAFDDANGYLLSSGAGSWTVGIPNVVGERIKSITFERFGDAAADLSGGIFVRPKNSTPTSLFVIGVTNPAASWVDEVCNFADEDIGDGDMVWITFTANAANLRIGEIRVTYSTP